MSHQDDQALLERTSNRFAVLLVLLVLVAAPIGFLSTSLVVSTICGVLLMLGGVGLALMDWVVKS